MLRVIERNPRRLVIGTKLRGPDAKLVKGAAWQLWHAPSVNDANR
jgi:hypothetical protein